MNIFDAIEKNDIKSVKKALEMGVNVKGKLGCKLLSYAVGHNRVKIAQLLIEKGANIDEKSYNGETALIAAAKYGRTEIVKLLIDNGASINEKDNDGYTALNWAVIYRYNTITQLLINKGAKNILSIGGISSFNLVIRSKSRKILNLFLKHYSYNELVRD